MFRLKKHYGICLGNSTTGFDSAGATFGYLFHDSISDAYFLFYTGVSDSKWSKASIGLAISNDGITFKKKKEPLISKGKQSVTPVIFESNGMYWMAFSYSSKRHGRRLAIACSNELNGPWEIIRDLHKPSKWWEGNDLDLGPSIVKLSPSRFLIFYSNVSNHPVSSFFSSYIRRKIGYLILEILSQKDINVKKCNAPLSHLNGPIGSWKESLFCPGYFYYNDNHYLLPSASTYSIGFPYKQYIGITKSKSPFFNDCKLDHILINGPKEKKNIMPDIKDEIALDTPSSLVVNEQLYLYYAVMDRYDGIWKMALSSFELD